MEEHVLVDGLEAPVHVAVADVDGDGDDDLLIACMGQVFPNNERIGSVVVMENTGSGKLVKHTLLDHVERVTDVQAGDFNGDKRIDLAVAHFGYNQGRVSWLENEGNWRFEAHTLVNLSGAINVVVADFDGDHDADIATVLAQEWEQVLLLTNDGKGTFTSQVLFASTNEDFGSSNLTLGDVNRDGRPDLIYSNGDGFDLASPGPRPWHGVRWLENAGGGGFRVHQVGDLPGAYGAIATDLDQDGAMDIVAVGAYADWSDPKAISLAWFRNNGKLQFQREVLAHAPTHLLTVASGTFSQDGAPALVTGAFHAYPPFEHMSRVTLWTRTPRQR